MIFAFGCGDKTEYEAGGVYVRLNSRATELEINVMPKTELLERYGSSELILVMLEPGQSFTDLNSCAELARRRADSSVEFKVKLTENGKTRLYNAFTAVFFDANTNTYVEAVDNVGYVSNPEKLSKNSEEYKKTSAIKGLNVVHDSEASSLGISHAMIDIPFEDYILPDGDSDAISFIFCGKSYYLDRDAVETLDGRVKFYTDNDVSVYLRFVLRREPSKLLGDQTCLAYPGAADGSESYALNMSDVKCAQSVAAFADFIAGRYAGEDNSRGSVAAFVVGDDLNTPGKTVGSIDINAYYSSSFAFVRTVCAAMLSHRENGRVYVDVDNNLKAKSTGACDSSAQEYLTRLAEYTAKTGDVAWGVSASVMASSADPDRIWYDNSGNGVYLTPSNLASLSNDVMSAPELLYNGERRNMIIGDFSVSVGTGENSENNQAASYAYAYYKTLEADAFDALIYSTQADKESDRSGLYATNLEGDPVSARKIHGVFCDIDTDKDIDSFVGSVINDGEWDSLHASYFEKAAIKKNRGGSVAPCDPTQYSTSAFVDFSDGTLGGFEIVGDRSYLGLVPNSASASLRAVMVKSNAADTPYIVKKGIKRADIQNDNLLITLSAYGTEGSVATAFNIRIELVQSNEKGMDVIYKSDVQSVSPGTTLTLAFNVKEGVSELKKNDVELRIYAEGNDGSSCVLTVDRFLAGREKTNIFLIVLLCVLAAGALIAVGALAIVWFRKNYEIQFDRAPKKGKENKSKEKKAKKNPKEKSKEKKPEPSKENEE